jgi:hypothetical protein
MTSKLQQLIDAANAAAEKEPLVVDEDISIHGSTSWCKTQRKYLTLANPATILELCALLEKAEEALDECDNEFAKIGVGFQNLDDALAAIKQCKEGT